VGWRKTPPDRSVAAKLITVVNCRHAVKEKKTEDQPSEIKKCSLQTSEEGLPQKDSGTSEEDCQKETIENEIAEREFDPQEENPSAAHSTAEVFLGQRRRTFP